MNLPLQERMPGVYQLPPSLAGLIVEQVDGRNHLGRIATDGYFDPPLCGADTGSRNVARRREHRASVIPMCRTCARLAGVEGA